MPANTNNNIIRRRAYPGHDAIACWDEAANAAIFRTAVERDINEGRTSRMYGEQLLTRGEWLDGFVVLYDLDLVRDGIEDFLEEHDYEETLEWLENQWEEEDSGDDGELSDSSTSSTEEQESEDSDWSG